MFGVMDAHVSMLGQGKAFADLSSYRKIRVTGTDAARWLNDLVSADLTDLSPGRAKGSLLLSPTGRIRAEFAVAAIDDAFLLIQDSAQPTSVAELLERYVLSSDVALEDVSMLVLFAIPGHSEIAIEGSDSTDVMTWSPSSAGGGNGVDIAVPGGRRQEMQAWLRERLTEASDEDFERWRITAGIPRLGVDVQEEDLPQEAGLVEAVGFHKGCYLGQEAVAKVQNLGHPRRLLLHLRAIQDPGPDGEISTGDEVESEGSEAGRITSVARVGDSTFALARVRWAARHGPFRAGGIELTPVS
jgi:tRNA-modifying protein YgfZ